MAKIRDLIRKFHNAIPFEGDSRLKIRQVRDLSLFLLVYSVANGVIYAAAGSILFTMVYVGSFLVTAVLLWQTFHQKVVQVFNRLVLWVVILSVTCTWVIGKAAGYQNLLYCAMLNYLFDPDTSLKRKRGFSVLALLYVVVSIVAADEVNHFFYPGKIPEAVLDAALAVNEVMLIAVIIAFGMNYAVKKGESDHQLLLYNARLQDEAGTDPLTGLPNRRGFEIVLSHLEEEYRNNDLTMTLVMGDIDLFKQINDTYGHEAGDAVLKQLAGMMMSFMSAYGSAARWGGEEFLLAFAGMNGDDAFSEVEKFRQQIEKTDFMYHGTRISVRMTFGVEEYDAELKTDGTIRKADEKLYLGKQQGRNRVVY